MFVYFLCYLILHTVFNLKMASCCDRLVFYLIINFQWKMRGCNESVGPGDLATALGNTQGSLWIRVASGWILNGSGSDLLFFVLLEVSGH